MANPHEVKNSHEAMGLSLTTLLASKLILQSWTAEAQAAFDLWFVGKRPARGEN